MSKKNDMPVPAKMPDDYEMNSHIDTLHKAHQIKKDKPLMKKLHKHAKEKMEAMEGSPAEEAGESASEEKLEKKKGTEVTQISDIRKKSNKMAGY